MAKKSKKYKTDFEKAIEKNAKDFAEEIEAIAENFGIRVEKKAKSIEKHDEFGFRVFGFAGPFVGSAVSLIFLILFAFVLNFVNIALGSVLLSNIANFLLRNMHWFFALFLFSGYSEYFAKRFKNSFWMVSPLVSGIAFIFVIWISIWALNMINLSANNLFVGFLSNLLYSNMVPIALIFIVVDYVLILTEKIIIFKGFK